MHYYDVCLALAGLTRRSTTLCCPPLPSNADWWQSIGAHDVHGGSCEWVCKPGHTKRYVTWILIKGY